MRAVFLMLWALAITCILTACDKASDDSAKHSPTLPVLSFSAIPDQNTTELKAKFDPIAAYLSHKLGIPVRYIPSQNYAASVEMFKKGDIQLAWFGGLTGVQARHAVKGARAIAQGKADPQYVSYFIAHESVDINRQEHFPDAIKDLPFAFGSSQSTSGCLMPAYFIERETGLPSGEFFTRPTVFSGSHDKTLELVKAGGAIQAGVLSFKVYEKHLARDKKLGEKVKVIWVTPPYADYNFTAHPTLEDRYGAGFIDKLQRALIEISDQRLLDAFPREAIIKATNAEYEAITNVARAQGFIR